MFLRNTNPLAVMIQVNVKVLLITGLAFLPPPVAALSMVDFVRCIGPQGQGSVCQLDPGVYEVDSPLIIGRSNITVKGTIISSRADTTLRKGIGNIGSIMSDPFRMAGTAPVLTALTIRDFTFDGNRAQLGNNWQMYQQDVGIFTTQGVLITNCAFINAAHTGLEVRQAASGVVVNNSYFGNPTLFGIELEDSEFHPPLETTANAYTLCDSLNFPTNVVITNSTFENAGANAVITGGGSDIQIKNNVFTNNHKDFPFGVGGGQIDLSTCTSNAVVVMNVLQDGAFTADGKYVLGVEAHGIQLTLVDNLITHNGGEGIGLQGVQYAFVANWGNQTGAIANNKNGNRAGVEANYANGARPLDFIVVDHANSVDGHLFGFRLATPIGSPSTNHLVITNNCFSRNLNGPSQLGGLGPDAIVSNNLAAGCGPN